MNLKKLKDFLNEEVIDIVVIGSSVKGRESAQDLDILVISNVSAIRKTIKESIPNADVQMISLKDYDKHIWLSMIREGFSVRHQKPLRDVYGIKPYSLYHYSLKALTLSKKVMFERGLKNFKKIEKLSNRVLLVPVDQSADFEDFLKFWKIDFDSQEYHLLPLLRKEGA